MNKPKKFPMIAIVLTQGLLVVGGTYCFRTDYDEQDIVAGDSGLLVYGVCLCSPGDRANGRRFGGSQQQKCVLSRF